MITAFTAIHLRRSVGLCMILGLTMLAAAQTSGGTLRVAVPQDATSLDPHAATAANSTRVYNNIYETLVYLTEDLELEPLLATHWEQIDDTTWRFFLRDDVVFSDGTPFDAAAVKFTIERTIDPDDRALGAAWIGPVAGAEIVDDHTVDILTSTPHPFLLNVLSMKFVLGIVSPIAVTDLGDDFGRNPVGTGPFALSNWQSNDHIRLTRNPTYWGEAPLLDEITFRIIPDEGARILAFQNQEVDMLLSPTPTQFRVAQAIPGVKIHSAPSERMTYLGMNSTWEPLGDQRVREAIAHAIDMDTIVGRVMTGIADRAESFVVSGAFGYKDQGISERYAFDPQLARDLLTDAGWQATDGGIRAQDGTPLRITLLLSPGRDPGDRQVAEVLQDQLRQVGIDVDLRFMEWAPLLATLRQNPEEYGLYMMGWNTVTLDADFGLNSIYNSSQMPPVGSNRMFYANPEVDELLTAAQQNLDVDEREAQYGRIQDVLADDLPVVPLFHLRQIVVTQPWVRGYSVHPSEYYTTTVTNTWLDR